MRKFLSFFAVLGFILTAAASDTPKNWLTNLEKAQAKAVKENKPILILVSGPEWCGPCYKLHKTVIENKEFEKLVHKYAVCLYLHAPKKSDPKSESEQYINELKDKKVFKTGGVPRYAVVSPELKVLDSPKQRTIFDFMKSISDAGVKMGKSEIPELKKLAAKLEKDKKKATKKSKKSKKSKNKKSKKD